MNDFPVSISSCVISLERIGRLELLHELFNSIIIPPSVANEIGISSSWLKITAPSDFNFITALRTNLGRGESEAIALALEKKCKIILDDEQARKIAKGFKLQIIGTMGALLLANQNKLIQKISPIIDELELSGFYLSLQLKKHIKLLAEE